MLQIDFPSLIIQILNFLVLLFVLNFILYRPVLRILNKRREDMASSQKITENFFNKAKIYSERYKIYLDATKKEGINTKEDLRNEALVMEKEMLQKTFSSVEEKLVNTREEIIRKVEEARINLQVEVELFSQELANKFLGRHVQ
ncbi:MAG: hypothetical protein JW882_02685 [Deltaproteobacteria bacterium]|nr:hypothetical protein [Deltaproteobacteria bacterium]